MKIKHNREGGGGGGGQRRKGKSRPTPSDFLCNESIEETCQRSTAFLTHTLLIVAGVFKAEPEMPKNSGQEKYSKCIER